MLEKTPMFLQQLLPQAPSLLAYAVGLAFALYSWRRWPITSLLTAAGTGLLLIVAVGHAIAVHYVFSSRDSIAPDARDLSSLLISMSLLAGLVRALGIILLLVAVFLGRPERAHGR